MHIIIEFKASVVCHVFPTCRCTEAQLSIWALYNENKLFCFWLAETSMDSLMWFAHIESINTSCDWGVVIELVNLFYMNIWCALRLELWNNFIVCFVAILAMFLWFYVLSHYNLFLDIKNVCCIGFHANWFSHVSECIGVHLRHFLLITWLFWGIKLHEI